MLNEIIERLRKERSEKRLTLEQLAIKSGVSAKHICNIENGKTNPNIETLQKIAKPLGLKIYMEVVSAKVS